MTQPKRVAIVKNFIAYRKWCRTYTGVLEHEVVVPIGPAGQPGESLRAPSPSAYPARFGPDGSREDFRVLTGPGGSSFASVCLGTVADRGEPEAVAREAPEGFRQQGFTTRNEAFRDAIAGHEAWGHSVVMPSGVLTDWHFAHAGWYFIVGAVCNRRDDYWDVFSRTRSILSTWEWLET